MELCAGKYLLPGECRGRARAHGERIEKNFKKASETLDFYFRSAYIGGYIMSTILTSLMRDSFRVIKRYGNGVLQGNYGHIN